VALIKLPMFLGRFPHRFQNNFVEISICLSQTAIIGLKNFDCFATKSA
jgi:hypothetical protein